MPDISIIIPVYNTESCLENCVNSALEQDFQNFELLLLDDGSTDGSGDTCDRLSQSDPRIKVVHLEHGGVSRARNTGIELAQGKFIFFMDSDDVIVPDCLSALWDDSVDFAVGGFERRMGEEVVQYLLPMCRKYNDKEKSFFLDDCLPVPIPLDGPCAKLYRKSIIDEWKLRFNETLSYAEDKLFVSNYLLYAKSFRVIGKVVYIHIKRTGSLSSDIGSDKHVGQLLDFLPHYTRTVERFRKEFPCKATFNLYHQEVTSRYVYRILNIFKDQRCKSQTLANVAYLSKLLNADQFPPLQFDGKYVVFSYYISKYFGKFGLYAFMKLFNAFRGGR